MTKSTRNELPAIIDVEASGFGKGSYPIEVGVILPDGKTFCTLIKPLASWTSWDKTAETVHHVPRALLFEKGKEVRMVAEKLNTLLAGKTVYSDAWGQDFAWVSALFEEAEMHMEFKIEALSGLLTDMQKAVWHDTRARVQQMLGLQRHRASADAKVIQMTFHWSQNSAVCRSTHSAMGAA